MKYLQTLKQTIDKIDTEQIENVKKVIKETKGIIYICGNGGSLSTATHFSNDFTKQAGLKTVALDNSAIMTAYANDTVYKYCFSKYLERMITKKDLLLCISASGNSKNVIESLKIANRKKATTICFLGFNGGLAKVMCKHYILVPSCHYGIIEDCHLILGHLIADKIKNEF